MNTFLISNIKLVHGNNFSNYKEKLIGKATYYIYSSKQLHEFEKCSVLIDGYLQPRNEYFSEFRKFTSIELVKELYAKYKSHFVNYIKGNFTIIIIHNQSIEIFTDHFGLSTCYIYQKEHTSAVTNSIEQFKNLNIYLEPDAESLAIKTLLHRIPGSDNHFKNLKKTKPASHIQISDKDVTIKQYWSPDYLLQLKEKPRNDFNFLYFADLIKTNFRNFLTYQKPKRHTITLTGGKDSRTGLAALKSNGITPEGFTYGNPHSRDAVYARELAKSTGIQHTIFEPPDTLHYFNEIASAIIKSGNPDISLHRAHRLYAFREMASQINEESAYYAGYMAGEFLMGIYYDNLIFTKFLANFWDNDNLLPIQPILQKYFYKDGIIKDDELTEKLNDFKTFDDKLSIEERQFYGIFEIGIPHHSQDIFLASQYFKFVYPFFIDIDFLEALFQSRFSFFFANNKTKNPLKRYKLFEFNLNVQHLLYPEMDTIPFGKRGSYNTKEFLRGKYYWSAVKTLRYLFQRQKYPATYTYGPLFRKFLHKHLSELNNEKSHPLHEIFNIGAAISSLESITGNTDEAAMHKFSNIVQLYLQLQQFNK